MGHILIIEEDPSFRRTFESFLSLRGHSFEVAASVASALTAQTQPPADLAVVSVAGTGVDPGQVARIQAHWSIPVIATFSPDQAVQAGIALDAGARDAFLKAGPSRAERLCERVDVLLEEMSGEHRVPVALQASLLDRIPSAVIATSASGAIRYWNPAAERLHGWLAKEVLGSNVRPILFPEAELERASEALARLAAHGHWEGEIELLCKDGSTFPALLSLTQLDGSGGAETLVLGATMDLSERRAFEARLLQAQKMEAVGTLAGGLAHDFNNLLTGVLGSAALVREAPGLDPDVLELMDLVERSALRGRDLCRQLLSFSRAERPKVDVMTVDDSVGEVVTLIERTVSPDIHIHVGVDAGLPHLMADRSRVTQAIMNLLINGRDALEGSGHLTVSASLTNGIPADSLHHALDDGTSYVRITVADDGHGMPPEVIARAYEPFFTTKGSGKGTGLGLSIAFSVARSHGGQLRIWSAVGKGSAVAMFLPVTEMTAPASTAQVAADLEQYRGSETVLVVDDEAIARGVGGRILRQFGYDVVEAASGTEALRVLAGPGCNVAVVLLDVVMPEMEGPEVFRRMRQGGFDVPVILCSGFSVVGLADELLRAGVAAVVDKPYRLAELLPVLRQVLGGTSAAVPS